MSKDMKVKGQLQLYVQWPLMLSILLAVMNIVVYLVNVKAGVVVSGFLLLYILIAAILYFYKRPGIVNELISFATQYGQVQKSLLREFCLPYALLDNQGCLLWMNEEFSRLTGKNKSYHRSVTSVLSEVTKDRLPLEQEESEVSLTYQEREYRVQMKRISMDEILSATGLVGEVEESYLIALYMFDETEMHTYIREIEDEKLVVGLLYLDNYDEALNSVEEVRRSLLTALIDRKISKYFGELDGLVKKLEKDKYFLVMRNRSLKELQAMRFNILEDVKTVNIGNDMAVTISIGIGMNTGSYAQNYEYSRIAIDLALGRGGDQVVIKEENGISYFGGKSQQMGKSTRVKARVKAHALREFMSSKDKIVVMGHKTTDADALGAAIGIYRAAKYLNKRAHIVVNDPNTSIRPLMDSFLSNPDYDEYMFIDSHKAKEIVDQNTAVIVVDTNRPNYTECEELLHKTKTIVVLDHHRQGSEVITNAVLSYIEPYASSACEMVAEILQYFAEDIRLRNIEADSLYAGIMVDTNNFLNKTGVRTFEAAAFLRRCGADVTRVRKIFREDMDAYKAKAEAVRHTENYRGCFAISICPNQNLGSPTVVAAQAANELLNIIGVKASFVLIEYNDQINISARAIDEVNVQLIMERLGGGGHISIAGAQLKDMSLTQATDLLKKTIDTMLEEGEI
ncbi:MAG: DHH family phosphoesterase [Lachnospiraceae bacterium]